MKGLKPKNKIGAAFCSYGWSGEAMEIINRELEEMKFELIDPGVKVQFVPGKDALESCRQLGRKIGERLAALED
jgi:flavorubredoxin